ncbi:hypothetical protein P692DRAFT_20840142 [Suillus brevipes Sb2]|nr:hypothetical protein P692DRAFT_20840142 [Suillus brevipes Sb2]
MANIADAAAPKVVPGHDVDSGSELNSTSPAVGSTAGKEEEDDGKLAIPLKVYGIAKGDDEVQGKVNLHIPEMVWFNKFKDTSTAAIRKVLELKNAERGKRFLHITVSRKLRPITKLSGRTFLSAWWHIVVCHYALWGRNVHHRDISPNNLMVYKTSDGRYIGVLIDFDFSLSPSGRERAGTVPFMAIELLTKDAIEGQVKHLYQHDAESFIWVLAWICLRYEEGQLLRKGRPLDQWLKVDFEICSEKKIDFLYQSCYKAQPSSSHQSNWKTALACLFSLSVFKTMNPTPTEDDEIAFRTWLEEHILKAEIPISEPVKVLEGNISRYIVHNHKN